MTCDSKGDHQRTDFDYYIVINACARVQSHISHVNTLPHCDPSCGLSVTRFQNKWQQHVLAKIFTTDCHAFVQRDTRINKTFKFLIVTISRSVSLKTRMAFSSAHASSKPIPLHSSLITTGTYPHYVGWVLVVDARIYPYLLPWRSWKKLTIHENTLFYLIHIRLYSCTHSYIPATQVCLIFTSRTIVYFCWKLTIFLKCSI